MALLISLCQPLAVMAEEVNPEITDEVAETTGEVEMLEPAEETAEGTVEESVDTSTEVPVVMVAENAIYLGDFRFTYYCCEPYRHICGLGTGTTKSGRIAEPGRSVAVDPDIIPLGSIVWIDFGDGEGWHEYSADDIGSAVQDNHIDIVTALHCEALSQTKVAGQVYYLPPA